MSLIPTTEPHDMDTGAMMREAAQRGVELETYDPGELAVEVRELLAAKGLHPETPEGTGRGAMATGAAGQLLRAFGILPAGDARWVDRPTAADAETR